MNAREQYLQKRVERLEALIAFLRADLDYTESVGAAFAFDLALYEEDRRTADHMLISWDESVKEALREDRG